MCNKCHNLSHFRLALKSILSYKSLVFRIMTMLPKADFNSDPVLIFLLALFPKTIIIHKNTTLAVHHFNAYNERGKTKKLKN